MATIAGGPNDLRVQYQREALMVEAALDLAESSGCLQADAERVETDGRDRAQLAVDALQRLLTAMTRRHGVHLATFRLASAICRRWVEWPASNTSDVRVEAIAAVERLQQDEADDPVVAEYIRILDSDTSRWEITKAESVLVRICI